MIVLPFSQDTCMFSPRSWNTESYCLVHIAYKELPLYFDRGGVALFNATLLII